MRRPRSRLPWRRNKPVGLALDRFQELVDAMLADPSPAGLVVTIGRLQAPPAFRTALREQLLRLKKANRQVVVHLPQGGSSPELLIASAASRVLLGAQTTLGPLGFQMGSLYLREALDKVGLEPDVHAEGAYKTAGETFARTTMSEPQREQLGRVLDVFYDELVSALAEARAVSREVAVSWIERGLIDADQAVELGLADAAVHDDELLYSLTSVRSDSPARTVNAGSYLTRRSRPLFAPMVPEPMVGIIEAHGPIVEHMPGNVGAVCDAERVVALIERAEKNPRIVGVVLHIDSPGGGVLASEKIHRAVTKLAARKPVVACFGGVSASGGYYIGVACDAIVARPTTITGSIGVVAARVLAGPLLAKLGVRSEVVRRGAHADMLSMTRPFDEDEKRIFDAELARAYKHFVSLVARGRRRTVEEILPLAGGRVWTGQDALAHGLVDRLGGLDEALAEVRARAGDQARGAKPVLIAPAPRFEPPSILQLLPGLAERAAVRPLVELAQTVMNTPQERTLAVLPLWPLP